MGEQWKKCQTLFFWTPKSLQMVTAAMKLKDRMGGEEGGGFRMGNTCIPVADAC